MGVHSDEAILENKGPTVMTLRERLLATDACRWVTQSVPYAPYVTQLDWISHFGCKYVVHGDDITSDSSGEDCYRFVKAANRFKVVKRTPSISTTDLVGRMLLCTRTHFVRDLEKVLEGEEGSGSVEEKRKVGEEMKERIRLYATDETAKRPGADVWFWKGEGSEGGKEGKGVFRELFKGIGPKPGQRVVYVDGGFDLFSSGHIEFLRLVTQKEEELAREEGWYSQQAVEERKGKGADYGPAFVVAGVHDDEVINREKGVNYPIMNVFERGLCVLQCKVCLGPNKDIKRFMLTFDRYSTSTPSFSVLPSSLPRATLPLFPGALPMPSTTVRHRSCRTPKTCMLCPRRWVSTRRSATTIMRR